MRIWLRAGVAGTAVVSLLTITASARQHPSKPDPPRSLETLAIQVLLDRMQVSPGEIDGTEGLNTQNAVDAFERERGRRVSDLLRASVAPTTVRYAITSADMATPIVKEVPADMMAKSKLARLDYTSVGYTTSHGCVASVSSAVEKLVPSAPLKTLRAG